MKMNMETVKQFGVALCLSVILTLDLAPSEFKYLLADAMTCALLILTLATAGRVWRLSLATSIKPVMPLLVLLVYAMTQGQVTGENGGWLYAHQFVQGFVPYLLFYVLFRNWSPKQTPLLLLVVFVIPGLVHLAFMYVDIYIAVKSGKMLFETSSKQGYLEYVKDAPRVGRRYLSVALLHLLVGGLLATSLSTLRSLKFWACSLLSVSAMSLALLDARAAYASLFIGALLALVLVGRHQAWLTLKSIVGNGWIRKLILAGLIAITITIGISAGKSRYVAMTYSVDAAVHDVLDRSTPLGERPYVNARYWKEPIDDPSKCYLEGQFRCKVDQSVYLRVAWLLTGLKGVFDHPFGVGGYPDHYMGRLWGFVDDAEKYQLGDSFFSQTLVSFGLPGIVLWVIFIGMLFSSVRRSIEAGSQVSTWIVVGLILVCIGRGLIDDFSLGLWRYFMGLVGMCYGLLHSLESRGATFELSKRGENSYGGVI